MLMHICQDQQQSFPNHLHFLHVAAGLRKSFRPPHFDLCAHTNAQCEDTNVLYPNELQQFPAKTWFSPCWVQRESWQHQKPQLLVPQQEKARGTGVTGHLQCCLKSPSRQTKGNCWEVPSLASRRSWLGLPASRRGSFPTHTSQTGTMASPRRIYPFLNEKFSDLFDKGAII